MRSERERQDWQTDDVNRLYVGCICVYTKYETDLSSLLPTLLRFAEHTIWQNSVICVHIAALQAGLWVQLTASSTLAPLCPSCTTATAHNPPQT